VCPEERASLRWLAFVCQLSRLRITEFAYEALEPDFLKAGFRFQRGGEVAHSGCKFIELKLSFSGVVAEPPPRECWKRSGAGSASRSPA
jgi:hypothetical protein